MRIGDRVVYRPPVRRFAGPGVLFGLIGFVGAKPDLKFPIALCLGLLVALVCRWLQQTIEQDGVLTGRSPQTGVVKRIRLDDVVTVTPCTGIVGAGAGWSFSDSLGNSVFLSKFPNPPMSPRLRELVGPQ